MTLCRVKAEIHRNIASPLMREEALSMRNLWLALLLSSSFLLAQDNNSNTSQQTAKGDSGKH